jgi:hypothetical protein
MNKNPALRLVHCYYTLKEYYIQWRFALSKVNDLPSSIKGREFVGQLSTYQLHQGLLPTEFVGCNNEV